jgi:hypothetical protein
MLKLEVGVVLRNVESGGVMVITSVFRGSIMDETGEVKEHWKLAVKQLTHTGRRSSHCESVSQESHHTCHMRHQTQRRAGVYLDMALFTF